MTAVYCLTCLYDSWLLFHLIFINSTSPKDVEYRATLGTSTIIFHADPSYLTSHVAYTFISCVEHSVGGRGNPTICTEHWHVCTVCVLSSPPPLAAAKAGSKHLELVEDPTGRRERHSQTIAIRLVPLSLH